MLLLLYAKGQVTVTWLMRNIPGSSETVLRCTKVLESVGLIARSVEFGGRRRQVYALTSWGRIVATRPPAAWADSLIRNP